MVITTMIRVIIVIINFGTFDNFGVNNDQKVSHKMILMSKYKGPHGGKKGKKN